MIVVDSSAPIAILERESDWLAEAVSSVRITAGPNGSRCSRTARFNSGPFRAISLFRAKRANQFPDAREKFPACVLFHAYL